jgi:hypothetical protein
MHNKAAALIIGHCVAAEALHQFSAQGGLNLLRLMCAPNGMRPHIRSWAQTGPALLARLRREAVAYPGSPSELLLREFLASDLFPPFEPGDVPLEAVIPVELDMRDARLRLFNTLTTLGTPQDITLQELRIECPFLPTRQPTAFCVDGRRSRQAPE